MSKGNLFLGMATGKIGSVVLYRAFGEERARSWVPQKRNPRTWRQSVQRAVMKTAQVAYSSLMPLCRRSFQGFAEGTPCQAAFISRACRDLRALVAADIDAGRSAVLESAVGNFNGLGSELFLPNPLMVSDGGLPSLRYGVYNSRLELESAPLSAAPTYADVVRALSATRGDRLDVFLIGDTPGSAVTSYVFASIILEPAGGDMSTPFVAGGAVNAPNEDNEGSVSVSLLEDGGEGEFYLCFGLGYGGCRGGAVVRSRMYGSLRQYSPQYIHMPQFPQDFPFGAAVASYMDRADVYLNGGGGG